MSNNQTITIEAEIPANASSGEKFYVSHEERMFEVIVPENATAGETINIIVAKVKYDDLNSILEASTNAAIEAGHSLNAKYDIVNRATAAFDSAKAKATELDEKYNVSKSNIATAAIGAATSAFEKIKELNEKYTVVEKVKAQVDRLVLYGIEIDSKYDVTTTAARLVVDGVNAVVSSKYVTPKTLPATVAPTAAATQEVVAPVEAAIPVE